MTVQEAIGAKPGDVKQIAGKWKVAQVGIRTLKIIIQQIKK